MSLRFSMKSQSQIELRSRVLRRRIAGGLPAWSKPRLGIDQAQYPPRLLRLPASYQSEAPLPRAPAISLVTPCLNHAAFVEQTISSVLDQSYPALEYAVRDGGSTDGSAEIIGRHAHRLDRFESKPDGGQASVINHALGESSGEIMGWLNSDDFLLPGSLAYVGRYFAAHPEVDLVYGHRVMVDERGRDIGRWVMPRHTSESVLWFDFIPQETAFWRRRLWDRAGGIDESFHVAFDWDLFIRFHFAGARTVRLPRFLGAIRLHPGQKTQSCAELAQRELREIRERWHGRPVTLDEAHARVDLFRLKSVPPYLAHRVAMRLPRPRVTYS